MPFPCCRSSRREHLMKIFAGRWTECCVLESSVLMSSVMIEKIVGGIYHGAPLRRVKGRRRRRRRRREFNEM